MGPWGHGARGAARPWKDSPQPAIARKGIARGVPEESIDAKKVVEKLGPSDSSAERLPCSTEASRRQEKKIFR